ncbi:outer membrane efflux protein [Leptospira inadai serovar Lyme str. 10]|uniref:Outer membrane efflux protein n=3 Tax=Leptospira inadai TaxID=29506 RepID=V6HU77_9LEPT|nr:outer membrane efflux protein [Leptospira inadai serovar Lyme str. 10]PNV75537.1 TolC family protein [Leptospira inadai serovar Lyme]
MNDYQEQSKRFSTISTMKAFAWGAILVVSQFGLLAQSGTKQLKLTTEETVKRALESNFNLQNLRYQLVKSDSDYLKAESKYSWKIVADGSFNQTVLPFNQNNVFTGNKISDDTIKGGIEKTIRATGTYFKIEAGNRRFDSNAFEDKSNPFTASFSGLGLPPLYTGFLRLTFSQDLMKNAFGYQGRNEEKILDKQTQIAKNQVSQQISQAIVDSLLDFWDYSIKLHSLKTYRKLQENVKDIRNLTMRKQGLGLSEGFEVNQWNSLLAQADSQLETAIVQKDESKRKLARELKLDDGTELSEETDLLEEIPEKPDYAKDLVIAYQKRADYLNAIKQKEIAEVLLKNAKDNQLPSLTLSGTAASQAQTLASPQKNYSDPADGVSSFKYKDYQSKLAFSYPLFDKGVYAGRRDSEIGVRQAVLAEQDIKNQVRDDVRGRIDSLEASYRIYKNSIVTERETQSYYNGVLRSFRQGRADAVAVKNALDTLVQDQLSLTQAKVNFNIDLMRYYIAKNTLLERFDLSVDKLLPNIE